MNTRPPPAPDHLGWDLVRAARIWEARFISAMVAAGHDWFAEARGRLIQHIPRAGLSQTELVTRSGLTKQAVQQHLDQLEKDGILSRQPDPSDARRARVVFTETGAKALADGDSIKREIEAQIEQDIGAETVTALCAALNALIDSHGI